MSGDDSSRCSYRDVGWWNLPLTASSRRRRGKPSQDRRLEGLRIVKGLSQERDRLSGIWNRTHGCPSEFETELAARYRDDPAWQDTFNRLSPQMLKRVDPLLVKPPPTLEECFTEDSFDEEFPDEDNSFDDVPDWYSSKLDEEESGVCHDEYRYLTNTDGGYRHPSPPQQEQLPVALQAEINVLDVEFDDFLSLEPMDNSIVFVSTVRPVVVTNDHVVFSEEVVVTGTPATSICEDHVSSNTLEECEQPVHISSFPAAVTAVGTLSSQGEKCVECQYAEHPLCRCWSRLGRAPHLATQLEMDVIVCTFKYLTSLRRFARVDKGDDWFDTGWYRKYFSHTFRRFKPPPESNALKADLS